ncbi:MAG: DUF2341 domain-containing protein, partial [Candidatus Omnitrophica bacterium]|nr:DUF2341 domain-containing protein [Candidatus Omnitrophota bacterium]
MKKILSSIFIKCRSKNHLANKGIASVLLLSVLFLLSLSSLAILSYSNTASMSPRIFKSIVTKHKMSSIKRILIKKALDVDNDGYFEVLKEQAGNLLPTTIPVNTKDEWGTDFRYCTWDLGNKNQSNSQYTDNNTAPPLNGLVARIISAGKNLQFETTCTSTQPAGDDIVYDIFHEDIQNALALIGNGGSGGGGSTGGGSGGSQNYGLYRVPITITNTTTTTFVDRQVLISIPTSSLVSSGKMLSSCADVVFVYGNERLNHQVLIKSILFNNCALAGNTSFMVVVPRIAANSSVTIYMYYGGNSGALPWPFPAPSSVSTEGRHTCASL